MKHLRIIATLCAGVLLSWLLWPVMAFIAMIVAVVTFYSTMLSLCIGVVAACAAVFIRRD